MIDQYAQSLGPVLQAHPNWAWLMTFLIAFLESLPLIGTLVPGSVTMTIIGVLVGSGLLPIGMTVLGATMGAFLGDVLSYGVGIHYQERLRNMWPFNKRPQWLEAGESFFYKHGGKSILIGRFIGPLRSIIPLIAGFLQMSYRKFLLAAPLSDVLWAIAYMLPGILLGALSLQLPPRVATRFILALLLTIILLSVLVWLINFFSIRMRTITTRWLKNLWSLLHSHRKSKWLVHLIASQDTANNYRQLGVFLLAWVAFLLFWIITLNIFSHSELTALNKPIFEFLRSIRNRRIDQIMIGLTLLGDGRVIATATLFILAYLFYKHRRAAWHWVATIAIGIGVPGLFKHILYFPRPTGLLHISSTSSFPSGHTFISVLYYGFFATFVAGHLNIKYRRYLYYLASCLILLIAFSRLYLGAHWLTDVLASLCLGMSFLALLIISYRKQRDSIHMLPFALLVLLVTCSVWLSYFMLTYHKNVTRYSLDWPSQVIEENFWLGYVNPALPIYRQNRLGKPAEPMNIQFIGNIQQLKNILLTQGWLTSPSRTLFSHTLQKFAQFPTHVGTYLPTLYLNEPPLLLMTKDNGNIKLVLKLWRSNVYLSETWEVLYIGNITEYQIAPKKILYSFNVINQLIPFLKDDEWRLQIILAPAIPPKLVTQKWNGQILQLSTPRLY